VLPYINGLTNPFVYDDGDRPQDRTA